MNFSLETSEFMYTHLTFKNHFKITEANKKIRLKAMLLQLLKAVLSLDMAILFLVYFIFQILHNSVLKVTVLS